MLTHLRRALGVLLALAGLGATVLGVWFAAALGGEGTAAFTAAPPAGTTVVTISPEVLNRVPSSVTVSATTSKGGSVWVGRTHPADAVDVVGDSKRLAVTGVEVRDWLLTTTAAGAKTSPELGGADLWREQTSAPETAALVVEQKHAPETVVLQSAKGDIESLTLTWVRKTWFVEAVIAALVGTFLILAGGLLLWPRRHEDTASDPGPTGSSRGSAVS